jgi:hypothetical protein
MKSCRLPHCGKEAGGYGTLCYTHKRRSRRHGHPEQESIAVPELKPLRERIRARINKNETNPTWQLLRDRWMLVEKHADEVAASYARGTAFNTHEREAWLNIEQIALHADCMDLIEVVLAMYLLREEQPYRFKSDLAFDGQLVRRVRSLAPCNVGEYRDYKTGKIKRVYRDAKPKTVQIVAHLLKQTFGVAGLTVGRLERSELSKQRQEAGALYNALGDLL